MEGPARILAIAYERATADLSRPFIEDQELVEQIRSVCRSSNRATTRLLIACALAKVDKPTVDIRKPYTQIGDPDVYSGRTYDERYVTEFINQHHLPCNQTTAFLTPALRNQNTALVPGMRLEGKPKEAYDNALDILHAVYSRRTSAEALLTQVIRCLLVYRDERQRKLEHMLASLQSEPAPVLSAEGIVTLISQHLASPRSSRLPVLVVAACYHAAETQLGERVRPLMPHNAADSQTGALADLEITLVDDDDVVTSYEMKTRRVTINDIDGTLQKIYASGTHIDNHIFITTDVITDEVNDYAATVYERTGVELVVLDCISFLRHFLHLFHRLRTEFLAAYQKLLLAEPESAVRQELKAAFIALRQAAESGD